MATLVTRGEITPDPRMRAEMDAKIVAMIAETIDETYPDQVDTEGGVNWLIGAFDTDVLARAVLAKLRAEGVVQ